MKQNLAKIFLALYLLIFSSGIFLMAQPAKAASNIDTSRQIAAFRPLLPQKDPAGYTLDDVFEIINNAIVYIADIGAVVAVFMLVWAAFDYVNNFGNEEKVAGAKKTIMWALVGLGVMIIVRLVVDAFFGFFVG